jgi:hypothetical protein
VDVDSIPSPVIEPVSPMIVEEQVLAIEEMDVDTWGETQNPSTEKNPCNKLD